MSSIIRICFPSILKQLAQFGKNVKCHLSHPAISWQTLAVEIALKLWRENNVDLDHFLRSKSDDLIFEPDDSGCSGDELDDPPEVLCAVVGEDNEEGPGGGHPEGHQQALGHSLPRVPPAVKRFKLQAGCGAPEGLGK